MYREAKKLREEQAKIVKEQGAMLVVNSEETNLATLNQLGRGGVIRDSEIDVLKERVERMQHEAKESEALLRKKDAELKKVRGELGRDGLLRDLEEKERALDDLARARK